MPTSRKRGAQKVSFSIFTATYNRADKFLPQCIESIQNQLGDLFSFEHIVINNASTDGTAEYLKQAAQQYKNLKVINSRTNLGTARAFNRALKIASGDFLLTMGDDDMLLPHSLQMHAAFLLAHPKIDWASGYLIPIDDNNQLVPFEVSRVFNTDDYSESADKMFERLLAGNVIMCPSAVVKRQAVLEVSGWDEQVNCEDWDMWLKLANARKKYAKHTAYLSLYRIHKDQLTNTHSTNGTYQKDIDHFLKRYGRTA